MAVMTDLEKALLDDYQRDFPLSSRPYAEIAARLGVSEETVLDTLDGLQRRGLVSRVGVVFRPNRVGASTLGAMAVPEARLVEVADLVNRFQEVNHNYERESGYNLWFVVTAADAPGLADALNRIEAATGFPVMSLPLVKDYHIDLGFKLEWS